MYFLSDLCPCFRDLWLHLCVYFNVQRSWNDIDLSDFLLNVEEHSIILLECAFHCLWYFWCIQNSFFYLDLDLALILVQRFFLKTLVILSWLRLIESVALMVLSRMVSVVQAW